MTSELSNFAARLREFIQPGSAGLKCSGDPDGTFNGLALELFALQFKHNAAYRKICDARRVFPTSITHWMQIPAAPAAAFKELDLTCLPPEQRSRVFYSSGTTAQRPSRHFHSAESLQLYEVSLRAGFKHLRFTTYDLRSTGKSSGHNETSAIHLLPSVIILTPHPAHAPHSSLVHMFEIIRREANAPDAAFVGTVAGEGAWTLDFDATLVSLHDAIESGRPLLLLGTAFTFVQLLDFLAARDLRFDLPHGSRVMETGGYKGRSRALPKVELHALIAERLGILPTEIICEYGMSELSSQAYDLTIPNFQFPIPKLQRVFRFPPWARVQVISPETGREAAEGQTGLIRVFDLANVFSVMAIQTEDLGVRHGNGFELMGRAELAEPRGCSVLSEDA